jgi:amino acid permease
MRRRDMTGALRHGKGRSLALLLAVKVGIVVLVLALPAGLALSLGAAHGLVQLLLGPITAVLLVVNRHRARRVRENNTC